MAVLCDVMETLWTWSTEIQGILKHISALEGKGIFLPYDIKKAFNGRQSNMLFVPFFPFLL